MLSLFSPIIQLFCGMAATEYVVSGFIGSLVIAMVARRTKALTPTVKLVYGIGALSAITMLEVMSALQNVCL